MTDASRGDLLLALINGLRAADPHVSAWEIADSLYLTQQIRREQPDADAVAAAPTPVRGRGDARGDEERAGRRSPLDVPFDALGGPVPDTDAGRRNAAQPAGAPDAGLYADVTAVTGQRARRVRAPGGRTLSDPLGVMRALRPLMRRVPARNDFVLDVEATVQHAAEAQVAGVRVWSPILRPRQERWLSIDLVCDASASMRPWQETVEEFRRLLARSGGFRAVRFWRWDAAATPGLRRDNSAARFTLPGASDQRLILVVSDCLHDSWRDRRAVYQLAEWAGDNPVAVLQVLPEYLWDRTALADLPAVMAQQSAPSQSNRHLQSVPLRRADEDLVALLDSLAIDVPEDQRSPADQDTWQPRRPVPIPIVTLDPARLLPWARMVAGRAAPAVRAVLATPRPESPEDDSIGADAMAWIDVEPTGAPADTPEARVRRLIETFRGYASPGGRRLATCLTAVAPVTLSIMRVVRDALVHAPADSQIAELLMSGFFEELPGTGADPAYVWAPGVHEQLSLGLTASDFAAVTGAVTQWMGAHTGSPREMTALMRDPAGAERIVITDETRPFAYLYAGNLRRLHMTGDADRLAARAAAHERAGAPAGLDLQRVLTGFDGVIFRTSWSPDGRWLLTPSVDGSIRIWEGATGRFIDVLRYSREGVNEIAWLKGGTRFAAAGHDGFLRIWDIKPDGRLSMLGSVGPHHTDIRSAAGSPDGTRVAIGCESGLVNVYADTGREPHTVATLQAAVPVVAWSAEGLLIAGDVTGNVLAFDLDAGGLRRALKTGGQPILSLSTSPHGPIACGDDHGDVYVWTGGDPRLLAGPRGRAHTDTVSALAFSPDGLVLASKGMDGWVRLWRTDTWALAGELSEPNGNFVLAGLAWHPVLPLFATLGEHDRALRMWQVDMEQLLPVPVVPPPARQPRRQQPAVEAHQFYLATLPYWEVAFNESFAVVDTRSGQPLATAAAASMLQRAVDRAGITDLFVIVHGWNRDRTEARDLYRRFFTAVSELLPGAGAHGRQPGVLGVLWPSKVWSDDDKDPDSMPAGASAGSMPGDAKADEGPSLFGQLWTSIKDAGRPMSYFQMQTRARRVGASGLGPFLDQLSGTQRIHLIGHSVGARCAMHALTTLGEATGSRVNSLLLLQPAIPHLSFAAAEPSGKPRPLAHGAWHVNGPTVVTYSHADPVRTAFELAARLTGDDDVPGLSASAIRMMGDAGAGGVPAGQIDVLKAGVPYGLQPGMVINVNVEPILAGHAAIAEREFAWLAISAALVPRQPPGRESGFGPGGEREPAHGAEPVQAQSDFAFSPRPGNWPMYDDGNYTPNGKFTQQFEFDLLVGGTEVTFVEVEAVCYAGGRACLQMRPSLSVDRETYSFLQDWRRLSKPARLAPGHTHRVLYARELRPPTTQDLPIDIEKGCVEFTWRYRRGAELSLLTHHVVYRIDDGDLHVQQAPCAEPSSPGTRPS